MRETVPPSVIQAPNWLVFGPLGLALLLLVGVEIGDLDLSLFRQLNGLSAWTGPAFWAHVTILGDGLVCAVLLLLWIRYPERVWGGLLGAVVMVVILRLFKSFLGLPRPLGVLPEDWVTVIGPGHRRSAFPSGHAATMALFAGVWALSTARRVTPWLAMGLAVLVGLSRVAVGVHWPSDVLGGLALGWASAWIGLRWGGRFDWGARRPGRSVLAAALFLSALVLFLVDHTGYPGVMLFQRALALICMVLGAWEVRNWRGPNPGGDGR
jgi:membrane-associated phospholipid phosphatase